eukprot:scaffold159753_cov43-Tisochrysis_lutea.AAC.3
MQLSAPVDHVLLAMQGVIAHPYAHPRRCYALESVTRMAFLDLDAEVRTAVTVKDLRADD